ncbi:MAG: SGNH hydrolase domain-containing protein, partial [Pseudomonadota bacterium]
LVYRHGGYLYGKNEVPVSDRVSAVLSGKSDQERERIYWASFETMLQRIASPGRQITVLASIPELGVQLPKLALNKTPEIGAEARITILPEAARAVLQDAIHAKLLEFSMLARVVDPAAVFCPDLHCLGAYGGRAFYFDSHHLSIEGARFLAAKSKLIGMQLPDRGHDLVSQPSQNIANNFR